MLPRKHTKVGTILVLNYCGLGSTLTLSAPVRHCHANRQPKPHLLTLARELLGPLSYRKIDRGENLGKGHIRRRKDTQESGRPRQIAHRSGLKPWSLVAELGSSPKGTPSSAVCSCDTLDDARRI